MPSTPLSILFADRLDNDLHGVRQRANGTTLIRFTQFYSAASGGNYDPVSGAVSVNMAYQTALTSGTSPLPPYYIEEQGTAGWLEMGLSSTFDAPTAAVAVNMLAWAQARQTDNTGAYVGSGDQDHSTAVMLCKTLPGLSACLDVGGQASAAFAPYESGQIAAARWMASSPNKAAAYTADLPFSHRRTMHACAWMIAGMLAGDSTLSAQANSYIDDYCAQLRTGGWTLHPVNNHVDSTGTSQNVSGVLVAPGAALPTLPSGYTYTGQSISADGVLPERDDYDAEDAGWAAFQTRGADVNYQLDGLLYACYCLALMPPSARRTALAAIVDTGGQWILTQQNADGSLSILGDCRMGIGFNRDGSVKAVDYNGASRALIALYYATGRLAYYQAAIKMSGYIDSAMAGQTQFDYLSAAPIALAAFQAALPQVSGASSQPQAVTNSTQNTAIPAGTGTTPRSLPISASSPVQWHGQVSPPKRAGLTTLRSTRSKQRSET